MVSLIQIHTIKYNVFSSIRSATKWRKGKVPLHHHYLIKRWSLTLKKRAAFGGNIFGQFAREVYFGAFIFVY
jgi:hypothetical protein